MFTYAKAVTAFITSAILYVLVPFGISEDTTLSKTIEILVLAGLTAASVYFVPNEK